MLSMFLCTLRRRFSLGLYPKFSDASAEGLGEWIFSADHNSHRAQRQCQAGARPWIYVQTKDSASLRSNCGMRTKPAIADYCISCCGMRARPAIADYCISYSGMRTRPAIAHYCSNCGMRIRPIVALLFYIMSYCQIDDFDCKCKKCCRGQEQF